MSFNDKRLDDALDSYLTQTPEEYFHEDESIEEEGGKAYSCVLCGKTFFGYGNNPQPLAKEGRCCNTCNRVKVIPARMHQLGIKSAGNENPTESRRISKKKNRDKHKALGLCTKCSKKAVAGKTLCKHHLAYNRKQQRKRKLKGAN